MMSGIDLQMLAAANDGVLTGENAAVTGICIDSRKVVNGDAFCCFNRHSIRWS